MVAWECNGGAARDCEKIGLRKPGRVSRTVCPVSRTEWASPANLPPARRRNPVRLAAQRNPVRHAARGTRPGETPFGTRPGETPFPAKPRFRPARSGRVRGAPTRRGICRAREPGRQTKVEVIPRDRQRTAHVILRPSRLPHEGKPLRPRAPLHEHRARQLRLERHHGSIALMHLRRGGPRLQRTILRRQAAPFISNDPQVARALAMAVERTARMHQRLRDRSERPLVWQRPREPRIRIGRRAPEQGEYHPGHRGKPRCDQAPPGHGKAPGNFVASSAK
jgi:hypothetical protein